MNVEEAFFLRAQSINQPFSISRAKSNSPQTLHVASCCDDNYLSSISLYAVCYTLLRTVMLVLVFECLISLTENPDAPLADLNLFCCSAYSAWRGNLYCSQSVKASAVLSMVKLWMCIFSSN